MTFIMTARKGESEEKKWDDDAAGFSNSNPHPHPPPPTSTSMRMMESCECSHDRRRDWTKTDMPTKTRHKSARAVNLAAHTSRPLDRSRRISSFCFFALSTFHCPKLTSTSRKATSTTTTSLSTVYRDSFDWRDAMRCDARMQDWCQSNLGVLS